MSKRSNPAAKQEKPAVESTRPAALLLPQMTLEALEARVFLTVTGFQSAVNYASGTSPSAIATGDFTNNGRSDLVVVNQTSGTVSVFLASSTGTFGSPITLSDNASPDAVAVGDFLGNGDEDIAVANHSTGTVSVWLGNGNGGFSSPATYSVGAGADAIVSADLNNDGRDDLAVGTFTAGNVVVMLASSTGTTASNAFTVSPSTTYSLAPGINGIAAGELSTDGYKDLAVSNVGGTVTILHNDGTGNFTTSSSDVYNAGISPEGVVIGDFREPGDIAVADNGDGSAGTSGVSVLLNTGGTGDTYTADPNGLYAAGANPNAIVAANLNGASNLDLAVTDDTDNTVSLLYNTNTGSGAVFAAPVTLATGTDPDAIATGDFPGTGLIDLAVANKSTSNASVFLHSSISISGNSQSGTEGATLSGATVATFTDNESNASASDFTATVNWGDGTSTTGTVVSNGSGGFNVTASHAYYSEGVYTMTITVADTNNDSAQATASATIADAALTATAATIAPTAGASFTGAVATFTDADPNGPAKFQNDPNQYAAIIAWGDGHITTGAITYASGVFSVSGTHTYTSYGSYAPRVTIEDEGGSSTAVTSTANVADAPITATGTSRTGTEGASLSGTIATFTDPNTYLAASAFTAAITWGDGNTGTGTVVQTGAGTFAVTAAHTYADAGPYTIGVTVSDAGGSTSSANTSVTMHNAALGSTLATINATEGTAYTSTVATFTDANTLATAAAFSAVITWPDSTTSAGTIGGSGGTYSVSIPGGYSFAHAGSQPVSVAITGAGGGTTTASGDATVANAALSATLATVTATEAEPFTGTLATFTDANTAASASDFTGTITWDDGTQSAATVTATGTPGTFALSFPSGHSFTRTGNVGISLEVSGAGGGTATTSGDVYVANQTITATASTISASNGNAFSGQVATFSDPNTAANGADFTASIDWGDSTTTTGTVVNTGPGQFAITGSHTWIDAGTPTVAVTITGAGGGTASTSQNATVLDSPMYLTAQANTAQEGAAFTGTIATFTDGNPLATPANFSPSIDWGDGSPADTSATVTSNGDGTFSIVGTHTYTATGAPTVTVTLADIPAGNSVNSGATMSVGYAAVSATLATISATEGTPFSGAVATFTDANTDAPASEFAATIAWPDHTTSAGTVSLTSPGNYEVDGGFTFSRAGTRPVSVTITDPTAATTLTTASGNATVASAGVTVTGGSFECLQGFGAQATVATFSDAYTGSTTPASQYSATITWDDGSTSSGTIASTGNGTYSIFASHTFQTSGNNIAYSVSVTGPGMSSAATATGYTNVDSNSITATIATITATEGTPFTGTIATFANADTLALNPASDYTATITYDDGSTSTGTITALGDATYSVTDTHTFNDPGSPVESISITGPRVFSAVTASGPATVANAGVTVTGGSIAPTEGTPFTGTIATFTDANANTTGDPSAYTATITWDDGSTGTGTITALTNGEYSITATHTFNDAGSQSYSIDLAGPGLSTDATGTGAATVASAGITGTLATISATEGSSYTGPIATFTDADSLSTVPAGSYSATITWDDSTTSAGVITSLGDGEYAIAGTHTFQTPGNAAISISVTGPGAASTTITGDATVGTAELDVTAQAVSATEGQAYTGTIATFTSADANLTAGDFSATVDWGDASGIDSSPTIVADPNGGFDVIGTHTYAGAGAGTMTVYVIEGNNYQTQSDTAAVTVGYATVTPTIATITATEGTPFSGTIGTFTDSNASSTSSEFNAQITWDDGTTSDGTVTQTGAGTFAVTVSNHTFEDAGSRSITLAILNDTNAGTVATTTDTVAISNAALTATGMTLASSSGSTFDGPVATFTDANTLATAADFTATVDWGDSTTPSSGTDVTITETSPGNFDVVTSHQYTAPGSDTISIAVQGAGGGTATTTSSMSVAYGTITLTTNPNNQPTEGQSFTGTWGTFTDSDPGVTPSDFINFIEWGDSSPAESATIVTTSTPGEFALVATHTFTGASNYWVYVDVAQTGGNNDAANYALTTVGYQATAATMSPISATEGQSFSGTVATFTDAYTSAPANEFDATITWPDGSTTAGTITQTSPGNFAVTVPSYVFASAGNQPVSVAIVSPANGNTIATDSEDAVVTSAGVTVAGGSIAPTQGSSFSGTVATFSDAYTGSTTPASAYSATITWDDGTTTTTGAGDIVSTGNGGYAITANHTFQAAGDVTYSISVSGPGMAAPATDTGSADVASASVSATMAPISTSEGALFDGTVATFTDADASTANIAGQYAATVTWDDTTTSAGTIIDLGNGSYAVTAAHTFNAPGTPTESVSITGPGLTSPATASGAATIANAGITVTAATITPTQGSAFTGEVGSFVDANPNTTLPGSDYAATITWSDNTTSTGVITALGGGNYSISATNTFQLGGNQPFSISVTGPGLPQSADANGAANVTSAGVASGAFTISATEGGSFSGAVVSFHNSDTSAADPGSAYSATINWGDSLSSPGTVTATGNGSYVVSGSHVYNTAGASLPISVTISGAGLASSYTVNGAANVASAGISATLATITATEGTAFAGTVANFSDADLQTTIPGSAYSATITWSDNTTSAGTITAGANGTYTISGAHTFNLAGSAPVSVAISGPGGASASTNGNAAVSTAGLTASLATISTTEGTAFTGTVATFTDADAATTSTPANYAALITWAGGAPVQGTITSLGGGVFAVSGSYTFTSAGTPTVAVSITGLGNGLAYANGTASVSSGTLTAAAPAITAAEGVAYSGTIATFTDSYAATTTPASAFAALINWGDSSSTAGTVVSLGNGEFAITGSHTYTAPGSFDGGVEISGPGEGAAAATMTATVSAAAITATSNAIAATEGAAWSGLVATIHSADTASTVAASAYTATITWPDGTTSAGVVTAQGGGVYTVDGAFAFHQAGSQTVSVAITGPGSTSASATDAASIASAGITATIAPITTTEGSAFTGTVATFTDADSLTTTPASSYSAQITWPDGSTSLGTIATGTNGSYTVTGSYTFNAAGQQPVSIAITGPGGAAATATGNAGVSSAGLTALLGTITAAEGGTFTGTVATFTDADAATTSLPSDYTALITWAGGTPVHGTITALGNGAFAVTGSYTFTAAGTPVVSVAITGPANSLAYASGTATVTSGTLTATGVALTDTEGAVASGTVATFTDSFAGTTTPASSFVATITWGDNTAPMTGVVTPLGNGEFSVGGAHLYTAPGTYTVGISIAGPGGGSATASTSITVSASPLTATAVPITATQGTPWTGVVANVQSGDVVSTVPASALSATITWPGGATSAGTITSTSPGFYVVTGSNTFANAGGSQTVQVSITGPGNTSASTTDTAYVAASSILATLTQVTPVEGTAWTGQIARFTTPNFDAVASQFTATITWENNTTSTGTIQADPNGGFDVQASHTFGQAGFVPISVVITGPNNATGTASGYEKVSSATIAISTQSVSPNPVEGTAYTGAVATFSDSNTQASPSEFTATITWPDGSTSAGTVSAGAAPGTFSVTSPHVFAHGGNYPLSVTITSASGASVSGTESVFVANSTLTSAGAAVTDVAGSAFAGTVATFSDANLAAYSTDFVASVNFGDGNPSVAGTIQSLGNGKFAVVSSHTYTRFGSYPITVSINGAGGGSSIASSTATVSNASLASTGVNITESKGVGFTTPMGVLYSANPYLKLTDMAGTINWGDKQTSSVILQSDPAGGYEILGSHTYAALGKFNVTITLNEAGGGSTSVTSFVTVNKAVATKVGKTPKPKKTKAPKVTKVKTPKTKKATKAEEIKKAA